MSDILDKSIRLKNKIDRMKEDKIKAQGAYEQIMSQIKADYRCNSLEAAEVLIENLKKQIQKSKDKITKEHDRIEKELAEHE